MNAADPIPTPRPSLTVYRCTAYGCGADVDPDGCTEHPDAEVEEMVFPRLRAPELEVADLTREHVEQVRAWLGGQDPMTLTQQETNLIVACDLAMAPLSFAQIEFLRDIGQLGREVFAPNPATLKALRTRGLVRARLIGMRWWWVQPTKSGLMAVSASDTITAAWNALRRSGAVS